MSGQVDLRSLRGRTAVEATARRVGLFDQSSTAWHVAYVLGEAGVLPPSLLAAAGAVAANAGASDGADAAVASLCRAGWVLRPGGERRRGRPPASWMVTPRGRVELESWTVARAQDALGWRAGWARYFLARAVCEGEETVWSTTELVSEAAWRASVAAGLALPAESVRRQLRGFVAEGWLTRHVERRRRASAPWVLSPAGLQALTWLSRRGGRPLPAAPRTVRVQDGEHELRAAEAAAALLPLATSVRALTMGRRLRFDPARLAAEARPGAGFCLPDVAVSVRTPAGVRTVCVEVERAGSVVNLERHLAAYAAVASSWLDAAGGVDELVVAVVSRHRAARRGAVARSLAALPAQVRRLPWRVAVCGASDLTRLAQCPLDEVVDAALTPTATLF